MINQQSEHKTNQNTGWIALLLSVSCVLATYVPYIYTERISDEIWTFRFIYAFALFGILPTGTVFFLSELFLKIIFNYKKKGMSSQLAIIYGFTIGYTFLLAALFLLWQYSNSIGYGVSFSEFLFLPKNTTAYLFNFEIKINPFLIPNIITIISSPYLGWKINKTKSIETTLVTKE